MVVREEVIKQAFQAGSVMGVEMLSNEVDLKERDVFHDEVREVLVFIGSSVGGYAMETNTSESCCAPN